MLLFASYYDQIGLTLGQIWLLVLSVPWALLLAATLAFDWNEESLRTMVRASLPYPALYLGSAWAMSLRRLVWGGA